MSERKPCCPAEAARMVKILTFPDGLQIGIVNLDRILKEVADLKLTEVKVIKTELLDRVKADNYVTSGVEDKYAEALFREYHRKFGE
jgi:hypothetical protein